ncbi:hypothetical protein RintRC_0227 [Richelia intracellularis]|nr:hypothetical protein RintRC_0227 [Richelia intracellularis]
MRGYDWELVSGQNLDIVMVPTPRPYDKLLVNFRRLSS